MAASLERLPRVLHADRDDVRRIVTVRLERGNEVERGETLELRIKGTAYLVGEEKRVRVEEVSQVEADGLYVTWRLTLKDLSV